MHTHGKLAFVSSYSAVVACKWWLASGGSKVLLKRLPQGHCCVPYLCFCCCQWQSAVPNQFSFSLPVTRLCCKSRMLQLSRTGSQNDEVSKAGCSTPTDEWQCGAANTQIIVACTSLLYSCTATLSLLVPLP